MAAPLSTSTPSQSGLPSEYVSLLNDLNRAIHRERPRDILQFCANWFNKKLEDQRIELIHHSSYDPHHPVPQIPTRRTQAETIFEEPFAPTSPRSTGPPPAASSGSNAATRTHTTTQSPQPPTFLLSSDSKPTADFPPNYNLSRRTSVSAESLAPSLPGQSSPSIRRASGPAKTAQQIERIRSAISANLLFKNLDDEQMRDVLDAMTEKKIPKEGVMVIQQGDVGDFFYVVEEGGFDFYIRKGQGVQGLGDRVGAVGAGGSFGELALMYNAPRAASVVSNMAGILWALDRITFRRILMDHTSRKRKMYENFLSTVPLLSALNTWEKAKIADALETETFEKGEIVIHQGDVGEYFYLVESGEAEVIIDGRGVVKQLRSGDYFGELALLNDAPRAATVRAYSFLKVAKLDKRAFQRLLGPIKDIMARNDPRLQEPSPMTTS